MNAKAFIAIYHNARRVVSLVRRYWLNEVRNTAYIRCFFNLEFWRLCIDYFQRTGNGCRWIVAKRNGNWNIFTACVNFINSRCMTFSKSIRILCKRATKQTLGVFVYKIRRCRSSWINFNFFNSTLQLVLRKTLALSFDNKLKLRDTFISIAISCNNSTRVCSCTSISIKFTADIQDIRILTMIHTLRIVVSCNGSVREWNYSISFIRKLGIIHNSWVVYHTHIYAKVFVSINGNSFIFVIYLNSIRLTSYIVFYKRNHRSICIGDYKRSLDFFGRAIRKVSKYRNYHTVFINSTRGGSSTLKRIWRYSPIGTW